MLKADLISGVEQVSRAVHDSGIERPLMEVARLGTRTPAVPGELLARLLTAFREYALHASRYTRSARLVAETLALAPLEHADTWTQLITDEHRAQQAFAYLERVRVATRYLPGIGALLAQSGVPAVELARRGSPQAVAALLTVQVVESPRRFSTPRRLATLLESLELLYGACAIVEGAEPGDLSVVACDSGSDKTFELMGSALVITALRELILTLWDRVVFFRELPAAERYRQAAETLPILLVLREREQARTVAPEQAELVRRRLIDGAGKFLVSGATIPELQQRAYANPRTLMAPAPKLIAAAPRSSPPAEG